MNREANLSQALHLVNGDTVTQKIAQSRLIATLLADKKPPATILEELYVRTLCRKPTADEIQKLTEIIDEDVKNPTRVTELATLQAQSDQNISSAAKNS